MICPQDSNKQYIIPTKKWLKPLEPLNIKLLKRDKDKILQSPVSPKENTNIKCCCQII